MYKQSITPPKELEKPEVIETPPPPPPFIPPVTNVPQITTIAEPVNDSLQYIQLVIIGSLLISILIGYGAFRLMRYIAQRSSDNLSQRAQPDVEVSPQASSPQFAFQQVPSPSQLTGVDRLLHLYNEYTTAALQFASAIVAHLQLHDNIKHYICHHLTIGYDDENDECPKLLLVKTDCDTALTSVLHEFFIFTTINEHGHDIGNLNFNKTNLMNKQREFLTFYSTHSKDFNNIRFVVKCFKDTLDEKDDKLTDRDDTGILMTVRAGVLDMTTNQYLIVPSVININPQFASQDIHEFLKWQRFYHTTTISQVYYGIAIGRKNVTIGILLNRIYRAFVRDNIYLQADAPISPGANEEKGTPILVSKITQLYSKVKGHISVILKKSQLPQNIDKQHTMYQIASKDNNANELVTILPAVILSDFVYRPLVTAWIVHGEV